MGRRMFYDPLTTGHHVEFNLNILEEASKTKSKDIFVFGIDIINIGKNNYNLDIRDEYKHLNINYVSAFFMRLLKVNSIFFQNMINVIIIIFYKIKFNIDYIIILNLNAVIRLFPFVFFRTSIVGILFNHRDYIYGGNSRYLITKYILTKRNLKKVFILNDEEGKNMLNSMFRTSKFTLLPDPIKIQNNIQHIDGQSDKVVMLFLGAISEKKGIINFLRRIEKIKNKINKDIEIRIVGKVSDSYENMFKYELFEIINTIYSTKIVINYDLKFIKKEQFIHELINCDYLLLPYQNKGGASSGLLGYGMLYNKRIIGIDEGFLGDKLKKYKNGYPMQFKEDSLLKLINDNHFLKDLGCSINYEYYNNHNFSKFYKILTE